MNKKIEELYNKIDGLNNIIDLQTLEISKLKNKNKHIEQWWKETNVIIRNEKSLAVNDNAMNYIESLEQKIDNAIKYIKELQNSDIVFSNIAYKELLEILGENNE